MRKLVICFMALLILTLGILPAIAEETADENLEFTFKDIFDSYNRCLLEKDLEASVKYMDKEANEEFKAFSDEDKMLMVEFAAFTVPAEYGVDKIEVAEGKATMFITGYFKGVEDSLEKGTGQVIFVNEDNEWKIHEISVNVGDGTIGD